jgi:hypothetical protein
MRPEIKDTTSILGRPEVRRVVGAWVLVAWMVVVCSSYAYFMLRSFF